MKRLSYRSAGVDIKKANALVDHYKRFARSTKIPGVISNLGSFGGLFRPAFRKMKDPLLVSSTDGVGTKLKLAFLVDKHDTVGIDLVAMSANDCLCSGAEGLFFLDYIATAKIETGVLTDIVKGIADGCREAGYALIGGETAEMPGMYQDGEYDLAGFGVGIVDRAEVIDGRATLPGDVIIGLESSGLHSNGYSLARKALSEKELITYSRELLEPTRLYCKPVLALKKKVRIKGIAHVTGGAFYDKVPRIIPSGTAFEIDTRSWRVPYIFTIIQKRGKILNREMYRTFNMGIGMVVVVGPRQVNEAQNILLRNGVTSYVIGKVVRGKRQVILK